jgi:Uma2 family endonuclease
MANALRADDCISPDDYLVSERISPQKHEYVAGAVYMTAGVSVGHDRIAGNIYRHLGNQLAGHPCEAFSSDVKVRIRAQAAEFFYYPDVTVDCSTQANHSLFAEAPRVIFEVLSPDTERVDRGEKLRNYQALPTLDVYGLVDQYHVAVTLYRRVADDWVCEFLTEKTDVIPLPGIGCELPLAAIYERTRL